MSDNSQQVQEERKMLMDAKAKGRGATCKTFMRLSGPGWLQSAITLGGGSLASSLYLGVLAGFSLMWLQPVAMIMGVVMLSAIGYVTLSTGERPFDAINKHINPVLGWGWIIATLMANLVWSLPQFSLATGSIQQNLFPNILGPEAMDPFHSKLLVCAGILSICVIVIWFYDSGGKGIKIFEVLLKLMVAMIVVCFFGVIVKMSLGGKLAWGNILSGFVPNLGMLTAPADTFQPFLAELSEKGSAFWSAYIVSEQRDVMIAAVATAVGINMTFLLPYSMLRKGWDKEFRGLAIFDLSTGLFIPFILVTGCVVMASATQFHTAPKAGVIAQLESAIEASEAPGAIMGLLGKRMKSEIGATEFTALSAEEQFSRIKEMPMAEKAMAARLVRRDANSLAQSLTPLLGAEFSHFIFGFGVVGMAISSIIILMLINGFVVCEMLGVESKGWPHRLGCLMPAIGVLGPFIWTGKAKFWLAVPTSVFGMALIFIAYWTFFFMMNSKSLLGDNLPKGGKRVLWNTLMLTAAGLATFGSFWAIWSKVQWKGIIGVGVFLVLALVVHFVRASKSASKV
jgi:Mn2+/Fe2+ NRAMP family transporter